jgi:hypothetical protein
MKKISLKVAVCLTAGCFLLSSCFVGQFGLFNKYVKWQTNMTNNKYVNAIIGFVIGPIVSSVCLLVDTIVLNTVEFWSGSNPVASNIGKTQQVLGSDGRYYAVTTLENGYDVKASTGEVTRLIHHADNDSWWVEQNGVQQELFRYNADGTIQATINGESRTFTLNEAGVYDARMLAGDGLFFAMN